MNRFQRILVPTDLSEQSRRGLGYACSLASENNSALTLLHVASEFEVWELCTEEFNFVNPAGRVWFTDQVLSEATLELNRYLEPHLETMKNIRMVTKRVVQGPVACQIVIVAEEEKADLIVMSPRRQRGLRRVFARSITDSVTRMSPCPVLSVMPPLTTPPWRGRRFPAMPGWPRPKVASI